MRPKARPTAPKTSIRPQARPYVDVSPSAEMRTAGPLPLGRNRIVDVSPSAEMREEQPRPLRKKPR
jgi:hypothetical protein